MAATIDLKVQFKTTLFDLQEWSLESTIEELKIYLQNETNIPIDHQKLLYKGKMLKDNNTTLAQFHNNNKAAITKLMLIGTPVEQVQEIAKLDDRLNRRQVIKPSRPIKRSVQTVSRYTFHRITVIEEFPQPEQARKLLERLRDDRGIRAIMEQRKWSVGELTELTPFEKTILGFNRNAGQLISIRLRTDDLSGFRHYDSIRKVLLHELTHNVWSEHDDNFHALNRQLNKDVISLDWTAHGAHALSSAGSSSFYQPVDNDNEYEDEITGVTWEGGSYRLGGKSGGIETTTIDSNTGDSITLQRELRARAAAARLTKQDEQELDEGCGCTNSKTANKGH
ncbi:WLM domain-containing protein [Phascolomyces articulosus]|uniref:WLM domain-containing protein n=1 Tax=Phascolomyces articulosus TaxID=60185 RepID=A0AAD5KSK7_9FUNG|nr:WLM domain-containing protein [Phascolomyces articulosus]